MNKQEQRYMGDGYISVYKAVSPWLKGKYYGDKPYIPGKVYTANGIERDTHQDCGRGVNFIWPGYFKYLDRGNKIDQEQMFWALKEFGHVIIELRVKESTIVYPVTSALTGGRKRDKARAFRVFTADVVWVIAEYDWRDGKTGFEAMDMKKPYSSDATDRLEMLNSTLKSNGSSIQYEFTGESPQPAGRWYGAYPVKRVES